MLAWSVVVLFEAFELSWSEKRDSKGCKNRSRYDLNICTRIFAAIRYWCRFCGASAEQILRQSDLPTRFKTSASKTSWRCTTHNNQLSSKSTRNHASLNASLDENSISDKISTTENTHPSFEQVVSENESQHLRMSILDVMKIA